MALGLAVLMSVRVGWTVAHTETGFDTLHWHWRDALLGPIKGEYRPVMERQHVAFWSQEVDRVLDQDAEDAELLGIGALLLNLPLSHYQLDKRERRLRDRSMELVTTATRRQPLSKRFWRQRAIFMYYEDKAGSIGNDTDPDMDDVLQQAAAVDAGNALYDYLAAIRQFESSTHVDGEGDTYWLVVDDSALFRDAVKNLETGLSKPYLGFDEPDFASIQRFLDQTRTYRIERAVIAAYLRDQDDSIVGDLWLAQEVRALTALQREEPELAFTCALQFVQIIGQCYRADPSAKMRLEFVLFRQDSARMVLSILDEFPELFDQATRDDAELEAAQAEADGLVFRDAYSRASASSSHPEYYELDEALFISRLVGRVASYIILMLATAVICRLSAGFLFAGPATSLGFRRQFLVWTCSLGISFVTFGVLPADVLPGAVRDWLWTAMVFSMLVFLVGLLIWLLFRGQGVRFSLRSMLVTFVILSALLATFLPPGLTREDLALPLDGRWIRPAGSQEVFESSLSAAVPQEFHAWLWPVFQWCCYHGPYRAFFVWVSLSVLWYFVLTRSGGSLASQVNGWCPWWASLLRSNGRSATVAAAMVSCVYLLIVPIAIQDVEGHYRRFTATARNPQWMVERAASELVGDTPPLPARLEE